MADKTFTVTIAQRVTGDLSRVKSEAEGAARDAEGAFSGLENRAGGIFSKIGELAGNIGLPFHQSFSKMGEGMAGVESQAGSMSGVLGSLGPEGAVAGAVIAGAAAAGAEFINLGTKMQDATAKIAANGNISQQAAAKIGSAFDSTGGTMTYTGTQLAQAYSGVVAQLQLTEGHALSAGDALKVMKSAADLAEASGTDLNSATSDLAKTMQAFQLPVKDASMASDVLYNSAKDTGTGVDSVTQTFQRLHSTLGAASPSLQQMGGLMLDLTAHGETGRKAVSSMNTAFSNLLGNTPAVNNALKYMGVNVYDANGQFVGMQSVIGQLQPKLAGMTQQQQLQALGAIFGKSANKQLLDVILAGPEAFQKYTDTVSKAGSAHTGAEKATNTLQGAFEKLKAAAVDWGTEVGSKLLPIVTKVIEWITSHWPEISKVLSTVGKVIEQRIKSMIDIFKGAWQEVEGVVHFFEDLFHGRWGKIWADVKEIFTGAWNEIKGIFEGSVLAFFRNVPEEIWKALQNLGSLIYANVIEPVVHFFERIPGEVAHVWTDVTSAIASFWSGIGSWVYNTVIMPVVHYYESIVNLVHHVWSDVYNAIVGAWSAVAGWVYNTVVLPVVHYYESIVTGVAHVWTDVVHGIETAWNVISGWVNSTVIQPVVGFFTGIPGTIAHVWGDVVSGLQTAWSDISNWVSSNVTGPIAGAFNSMASAIGQAINAIINAANVIPGVNIPKLDLTGLNGGVSNPHGGSTGLGANVPAGGIPGVTHNAEGGIIGNKTLSWLAEKGPEAVLPLTDYRRSMEILAQALPMMGVRPDGPAITGGNGSITLGVTSIPRKPDGPAIAGGSGTTTLTLNPPPPAPVSPIPTGGSFPTGGGSFPTTPSGPSSVTNNYYIYVDVAPTNAAPTDIADQIAWALKTRA